VWKFEDAGGGHFRIVSNLTGKCVEVSGAATTDGARVTQWDHLGGAHQQWRLAWAGAGAFAFVARHSGKVLEVSGQSTADGAVVTQWADLGGANQRWRITPG
jgi:hypothetical protein